MRTSKPLTIFTTWIDAYGIQKLAKELKTHPSTISKWKRGHCPRPWQMENIRDLSRGLVTYDIIVGASVESRR